jgi:hypothetical protein
VQSVYIRDITTVSYKRSAHLMALFKNERVKFKTNSNDKKQHFTIWHGDVAEWLYEVLNACIEQFNPPTDRPRDEGKELISNAIDACVSEKPPQMGKNAFSRQTSERTELRNQLSDGIYLCFKCVRHNNDVCICYVQQHVHVYICLLAYRTHTAFIAIAANSDMRSCSICMDAEISSVFLECGHVMACHDCAKAYKDKECPVCRRKVTSVHEIFWSS